LKTTAIDLQAKKEADRAKAGQDTMANQEKCRTAGERLMLRINWFMVMIIWVAICLQWKIANLSLLRGYSHDDPNAKQCGDFLKHDCNAMWESGWRIASQMKNTRHNKF